MARRPPPLKKTVCKLVSLEGRRAGVAEREGFVETSDHQALHYRLAGTSGPLLVFCDGVGCDGYIWKYLFPNLAQDHLVLHWQYRGHGQSSGPADYGKLTVSQMARDLDCLLTGLVEKMEISAAAAAQPVLLGHSLGSQVILEFHRQFGTTRVGALVPICGAAGEALDDFMHSKILKGLFPFLLEFFRLTPQVAALVWNRVIANPRGYYPAVLFQLTSTLCAKEDLQPYLDHLARIDSRVFMELAADMGRHTVAEHLLKIDVPLLVFAGSRDNFTPLPRSRQIAEEVPGAEYCLLRGGTHTAPLELPEFILLRLRKFLAERLPLTGS